MKDWLRKLGLGEGAAEQRAGQMGLFEMKEPRR